MVERNDPGPSTERLTVVRALSAVLHGGAFANLELDEALSQAQGGGASGQGAGFVTEVLYGTLRRLRTLDFLVEHAAKRRTGKLHPGVLNVLRMSLYQICFMDGVPTHAALNEAALLCRKLGQAHAVGFANGVLRCVVRALESTAGQAPALNTGSLPAKAALAMASFGGSSAFADLALRESHPEWIVESMVEHWGAAAAEALCVADNAVPPTTLRTNLLRSTRSELASSLQALGITCALGQHAAEALRCFGLNHIASLPAFAQGLFQVQDEGAMLVSHALDPKPGHCVLDMCAAPGGKAAHCAELMGDEGRVVALDIHAGRLQLVAETAARLGLSSVTCLQADARNLPADMIGFERVLLDAPCSGTGVIRRKPDIRWHRQSADLPELVATQRALLASARAALEPGGVLVYSTCSLEAVENEENVAWALANLPGLDLLGDPEYLLPHTHGTDGFFIARMQARP